MYNIDCIIIRHYEKRKYDCKHWTQDEKQVIKFQLISSCIEQKKQQKVNR